MHALSIRQADPSADREAILAVLGRDLPQAASAERHDWLYLANPDGPARVWLAEDEEGRAVGTSAAHPRRMRVRGKVVLALNLSDFAIDAHYRSLGPALELLKATLAPVREGEFAFSYDYPSEAMHALYRRMGGPDLGPNERWARPVDLKPLAKRRLGVVVGTVVGAAADAALRARDKLARGAGDVDVAPVEAEFGPDFDALDARLQSLRPVVGVRDARYLAWKYGAHTMWSHRVLCARRGGELLGFAVLREEEPNVVACVDLFAVEEDDVRRALAAHAVDWARERGAEALHAQALGGSATARMLERAGFVRREAGVGPMPFYASGSPLREALDDPASWWLIGGDRDI